MTPKIDTALSLEAKAIVALAFRNGFIEELHAGKPCPVCEGNGEYSHISDEEMKKIMKLAVNKVYSLLWQRTNDSFRLSEVRRVRLALHRALGRSGNLAAPPTSQYPQKGKPMFKELAPLLLQRAVTMTITCVNPDSIRVNVVPKKLADSENKALTTEVSIAGTAEDLDAQLPSTLSEYVAAHIGLKNTLDEAKEEMAAAAKAAKAEAKKGPSKTEIGKTDTKKSTTAATKTVEEKKPRKPRTPSLFEMAMAGEPASAEAPATAHPVQPNASESREEEAEQEIIAEITANDGGESEEEEEDDIAA
jgi:PRTRC genetic system protein E